MSLVPAQTCLFAFQTFYCLCRERGSRSKAIISLMLKNLIVEGGSWLRLKQMLCGNNYLRETLGGSGRDNETPRDLGVSFPRSKGVSSLALELAAVVRISFPFSLLLLFPLFPPPGSGDGGEGDLWSTSHIASKEPRLQWCCARNATR